MKLVVASAAAAAGLGLLLTPRSPYAPTTALHFPAHEPLVAAAPAAVWADGRYAFGRYKEAVADVAFHADASWLRTKLWHYSSFDTPDVFVGLAFVQLQYVSDVFLYVVDKAANDTKYEFATRRLGTLGLSFAASSIDARQCTSLDGGAVAACYADGAWRLTANVPVTSGVRGDDAPRTLAFDVTMEATEALTLLYPLANDPLRPAYVHKGAGSRTTGAVTLGNVTHTVDDGLGAIDWTKSMALRETRWNWASSSFVDAASGAAVGINLSQHVYDVDGASQENALWVNGRVCALGGVVFHVPAAGSAAENVWTIASAAPSATDAVDLTFRPAGARADDAGVPFLVRSRFVQPFGTFSGRIVCATTDGVVHAVDVADAYGVVEDHFALW